MTRAMTCVMPDGAALMSTSALNALPSSVALTPLTCTCEPASATIVPVTCTGPECVEAKAALSAGAVMTIDGAVVT
jgi:hypothetical protein